MLGLQLNMRLRLGLVLLIILTQNEPIGSQNIFINQNSVMPENVGVVSVALSKM